MRHPCIDHHISRVFFYPFFLHLKKRKALEVEDETGSYSILDRLTSS